MYEKYEDKMMKQKDYIAKKYDIQKQYIYRLPRDLSLEWDKLVEEKNINMNQTIKQFITTLIEKIKSEGE